MVMELSQRDTLFMYPQVSMLSSIISREKFMGNPSAAPNSADLNGFKPIFGMICIAVMGPMFFLILPLYVGALFDHLGFDHQQVGRLTSMELGGSALASIVGLFWIRRLSWRHAGACIALALCFFNVLSAFAGTNFDSLILLRVCAGFCAGSLTSLAIVALGDTEKIDRNYAWGLVCQLSISALLFFILPIPIVTLGMNAIYTVLAGCALVGLGGALLLPVAGQPPRQVTFTLAGTGKPLLGLLGGTVFFVAVSAVWAFIERMGVDAGLTNTFIGNALGLSVLASIAGAFIASLIADRFNRFWPMCIAMTGQLLCLLSLTGDINTTTYFAFVILYQIGWTLWVPYQLSVVAAVDNSGHFVVLITFFQSTGIALGPLLAAHFLSGVDYTPVLVIGAVFAIISLLLFIPITLGKK